MSYKANLRWAKKHGMQKIPFSQLPLQHQLAIAWYMLIDGDAWEDILKGDDGFIAWETREFKKKRLWRASLEHPKVHKVHIAGLKRFLPLIMQYHGDTPFGIVDIPTPEVKRAVMSRDKDMAENHPDFKDYHEWYKDRCSDWSGRGLPKHPPQNPWPCILSSFDDEVFEDGWHRFHRYVQLGMRKIPCIIYL